MSRLAVVALAVTSTAALAACGGGEADQASSPAAAGEAVTTEAQQRPAEADPRTDGFEVALGEWALTPEAKAVRPGRTTFVITNRGTMPHGFEIEREDVDDDDSKTETRFLQPGESVEVELTLERGVYKLECNVEGHDDMGMEMLLEVRPDAPLEATASGAKPAGTSVAIEGFGFTPPTITAKVGQEVTWENHDPADHTITQEGGGFDSGAIGQGTTFKATFDARASTATSAGSIRA